MVGRPEIPRADGSGCGGLSQQLAVYRAGEIDDHPANGISGGRFVIGKIFLGALGVLLLLPGLCSVAFMLLLGPPGSGGGILWALWIGTFAVAWGGFVLLRKAWNG